MAAMPPLPTFVGRVTWQNPLLLPAELYPPMSVPPGVAPHFPFLVPLAEIVRRSQARRDRYGYSVDLTNALSRFPAGYTDTSLRLSFPDLKRQWRREGREWLFDGGQILLTLEVGVYADERAGDRDEALVRILEHELLHVRDEIELVQQWLPARALRTPFVTSHFRAPIPEAEFQRRICGSGDGSGSELEQLIQRSLWIPESSSRARVLHEQRPEDGERIRQLLGDGP